MTESRSRLVIEISAEHARRNAELLNRELQNIERNGNYATTSMNSTSVAVRNLAGHIAALLSIGNAIAKLDAYTELNNKLKIVTHSQEELNKAMSDTYAIAQRSAASWSSVNDVYSKYISNSKNLNISQTQVAKLTEVTAKAVALSGSNAQSASAALFQYGQALDGGILRAEEYNSLVDGAGGLIKAMAKGLNVTTGELRQMMLQGKLTGDVIAKSLLKASDSVDELFSKTDVTIGQSLTLLSDALTKFLGEAGQGSGTTKLLSESIRELSKNLESVTNALMIGGAYYAGTYIPKMYESVVAKTRLMQTTLAEIKAERLSAEVTAQRTSRILYLTEVELANATAQASRLSGMQKLAYIEKTLIPLQQAQTVAKEADTIAQNANNASKITAMRLGKGLITMLGGAGGLVGIAVAVGASMLLMRDNTDEATQSLDDQTLSVDELKKKYAQLNSEQLKLKSISAGEEIEKDQQKIHEYISTLKQYINDLRVQKQSDKADVLTQYLDDLQKGGNRAKQAFSELEKQNLLDEYQIKTVSTMGSKIFELKDKISKNIEIQKIANQTSSESVTANNAETQSIQDKKYALMKASEAYKAYVDDVKKEKLKLETEMLLQQDGHSKNTIAEILKVMDKMKWQSDQLHSDVGQKFISEAKKIGDLKDRQEAQENRINQQKQEQTKQLEKQLALNKKMNGYVGNAELSGLRIKSQETIGGGNVRGYTAEFAKLTQNTLGTRMNRFTALNDRYHKGTNSKHATGNAFDVTVNNAKEAKQAVIDLNKVAKDYGFTISTINEYANPSKRATGGHIHVSVLGYKGTEDGLKNAEATQKLIADVNDRNVKAQEEAVATQKLFQTQAEKDRAEHVERMRKINESFGGSTKGKDLLVKETQRYEAEERLEKLRFDQAVKGWAWVGEEKLKKDAEVKKAEIDADMNHGREQKALLKQSVDEKCAYEIEQYKQMNQLKIAEYQATLNVIEQSAYTKLQKLREQAQLDKFDQSRSNLSLEHADASSEIDKKQSEFNERVGKDKELSPDDKHKQIIEAERIFNEERYALEAEFAQKRKDLEQSIYEQKLSLAQSGINSFETAFGTMSDVTKTAYGENSKQFKAMFTMQKSFAIASAGINIAKAISDGWATGATIYEKIASVGLIVANTASIISSIQSISMNGFAEGGYTGNGGKYDVAGVVHKGEVVFSQSDIARLGGVGAVESMRKGNLDPFTQQNQIEAHVQQAQVNNQINTGNTNVANYNFIDPVQMLKHALATPSGTKVLMNNMSENSTQIGRMVR